jgi:hypothetical protein
MVWGCISIYGPEEICRIRGKIDRKQYVDILEKGLKPFFQKFAKNWRKLQFQQDNDPRHTCKLARDKFKQLGIDVLDWPAQSLDLNPIEHVWSWIKDRLEKYREPPARQEELWDQI